MTPAGPNPDRTRPAPLAEVHPWGCYQVLDEADGFKVKRLTVSPGRRLSYQLHHHRAEHWVVVAGRAVVTLDGVEHELAAGDSIDIPREARHRVENREPDELVFIEVQRGHELGEDDIVRFDDDWGRT